MIRSVSVFCLVLCLTVQVNAQSSVRLKYADSVRNAGDYGMAARLYSALLEDVTESDLSERSIRTSLLLSAYGSRAFCHKKLANYAMAAADYDAALHLAALLHDDADRYVLCLNKSDLLIQMGAYEDAEQLLLSVPASAANLTTHRMSNLSTVYQMQGKATKAISLLDSLLAGDMDAKEKCVAFQNRGMCRLHLDRPDYAGAVRDFDKALSFCSDQDTGYYIILSNKAVADAHLGRFDAAVDEIDACVSWFSEKLGRSHPDCIIALRKRAEILYGMKKPVAARDAFREYYLREKTFVLTNFMSMTEQNRLDFWKKEKPFISEIFALEEEDPDFLFDVALFRRQVALLGKRDSADILQKLAVSKDRIADCLKDNDIAIEFIKYEKDGGNKYGALQISGAGGKNARFIPLWAEEDIAAFDVGGTRLDSALCSRSAVDKNKIYRSRALSSFVWDKLLPHIPVGSTVYFAPDGLLHLLAIEYLPSVNGGGYDMRRLTTTGLLAEERDGGPADGATGSLVVGGLNYDMAAVSKRLPAAPDRRAYDYLTDKRRRMLFPYLPGSRIECDSVGVLLSGVHRTDDCDESVLKETMGTYKNVHLATHGYSLNVDIPSVPYSFRDSISEDKSLLACGIAMSGANVVHQDASREDGLLSARELCEMNLSGVDLFVASCCQSAQGRVSDEGPAGIVRGLKKAGVRTIIASLWPVDDRATMLLMQFFYDFWREGKGKDGRGCTKTQALQFAQNRVRQTPGTPRTTRIFNASKKRGEAVTRMSGYDAPCYWAPFIIIDDV